MPPLTDKAALIVARGAQLIAVGTKAAPIVFTSSAADGAQEGWRLGRRRVAWAAPRSTPAPHAPRGEAGCLEAGIEGIPASEVKAKFGGTEDDSSCGQLNYVRIEFAGAELEPMKELNGLTFGGCGSGTKVSYVQVHRGTDDGIEAFGGTVGFDHVVLVGQRGRQPGLGLRLERQGSVPGHPPARRHRRQRHRGRWLADQRGGRCPVPRRLLYNVTMIGQAPPVAAPSPSRKAPTARSTTPSSRASRRRGRLPGQGRRPEHRMADGADHREHACSGTTAPTPTRPCPTRWACRRTTTRASSTRPRSKPSSARTSST